MRGEYIRERKYMVKGKEKKKVVKRKSVSKSTLNREILLVAKLYAQELERLKQSRTVIHVDEIASGIARFYEKIRKIIDWKEDNALRRGAIERILKRILFPKMVGFKMKNFDPKGLAQTITEELIRGGHLPNHKVPKTRVDVVSDVLFKYLFFLDDVYNSHRELNVKRKNNVSTFIIEIAACEIEEILTRPVKELGVMTAMSSILNKRVKVTPKDVLTKEQKLELVTISTQRKLYHLDDNYIIYRLLKSTYPNWQNPSEKEMKEISKKIPRIEEQSYGEINRGINRKFDHIAEEIDTVFMLFDDVLEQLKDTPEDIVKTLENKKKYEKLLRKAYEKRNKTLKARLRNSAIFSTLSVFISNWATFYLFEVPLAKLFYEEFNLTAAIVDFLLPTFVMFFLVVIIKPPKEENLERVVKASLTFIYNDEGQEEYEIDISKKRNTPIQIFMHTLYSLTAIALFGLIAYVFYIAKLPVTSIIYDTFTIALTVYAAVVVRNKSKELTVGEDRTFRDFILDALTTPVARVGSFLSRTWKEYNIVAAFSNFIIEIPLVATLNFMQAWSEYIKERKAEVH
jgi:hypothetical protein